MRKNNLGRRCHPLKERIHLNVNIDHKGYTKKTEKQLTSLWACTSPLSKHKQRLTINREKGKKTECNLCRVGRAELRSETTSMYILWWGLKASWLPEVTVTLRSFSVSETHGHLSHSHATTNHHATNADLTQSSTCRAETGKHTCLSPFLLIQDNKSDLPC